MMERDGRLSVPLEITDVDEYLSEFNMPEELLEIIN